MDRAIESIAELISTVKTLRGPNGCNWDRTQTLGSLRPYMLEEAYEVADAVDKGDMLELRKELGDLLLHIIMSADIAEDSGDFDLADVTSQITEKLKRRHPHVFDEASTLTPEEVEKQWEAIKAREKKDESKQFFDSIPAAMPSLQKAWRIQQRASEVGFPWPSQEKIRRHLTEKLLDGNSFTDINAGEMLFQMVNLLRLNGIEPEKALRGADEDFIQRFNRYQELLHQHGCTLNNGTREIHNKCRAIAFHTE